MKLSKCTCITSSFTWSFLNFSLITCQYLKWFSISTFSYPSAEGCWIQCLIKSFASPVVYVIWWASYQILDPFLYNFLKHLYEIVIFKGIPWKSIYVNFCSTLLLYKLTKRLKNLSIKLVNLIRYPAVAKGSYILGSVHPSFCLSVWTFPWDWAISFFWNSAWC